MAYNKTEERETCCNVDKWFLNCQNNKKKKLESQVMTISLILINNINLRSIYFSNKQISTCYVDAHWIVESQVAIFR